MLSSSARGSVSKSLYFVCIPSISLRINVSMFPDFHVVPVICILYLDFALFAVHKPIVTGVGNNSFSNYTL